LDVRALGAIAAGFVAGLIGLAYFAFFVKELIRNHRPNGPAVAGFLGVLFGATIASAPVGKAVFNSEFLWAWFMLGEAISFGPRALVVTYRYALRD